MLGRREILRASSRGSAKLRRCTSLGSIRRAGRRCLEAAPPARAPSGTASPAAERTKWCKRVCLETRARPGPRLAQRAKPNRAARTVGDASGPPAVAVPNTAPTRANCKSPPYPRTTSRAVPSRLKPTAPSLRFDHREFPLDHVRADPHHLGTAHDGVHAVWRPDERLCVGSRDLSAGEVIPAALTRRVTVDHADRPGSPGPVPQASRKGNVTSGLLMHVQGLRNSEISIADVSYCGPFREEEQAGSLQWRKD